MKKSSLNTTMTTQLNEIKIIILRSEPAELVAWFKDKTDAERSKLSNPLACFQEDITYNWHKKGSEKTRITAELKELGFSAENVFGRFEFHMPTLVCIDLATRPAGKLKEISLSLTDESDDHDWGKSEQWDAAYMQILHDRKLKNIEKLVTSLLSMNQRDGGGELSAAFLLAAIEKGVVKQPDSNDYLLCLTDIFDDGYKTKKQETRDKKLVCENKAFLERDAYRILQIESDLLRNESKSGFQQIYRKLMMTGRLKRARVLESLTRALFLDAKKNVLQGTVKFLRELKPRPKELLVLLKDLKGLLASQHSFVGKFAFDAIKELHEKNNIDDIVLLKILSPVFQGSAKGTAKAATTLIKKTCKSNPNCVPHGVTTILAALENGNAEVQAAALGWLKTVNDRLHDDHLVMIGESIEHLAATNRKAAKELANSGLDSKSAPVCKSSKAKSKKAKSTKAKSSKAKSTKTVATASGNSKTHTKSKKFLGATKQPQPLDYEPVNPINTHEELVDAIAKALEVTDCGMVAEQILDGISRLGKIPIEMQQHAAPVLARAIEKQSKPHYVDGVRGISSAPDATQRMRRVICLALAMEELNDPIPDIEEEDARTFGMGWPLKPEPMFLPSYEPRMVESGDGPGYFQRALDYAWRSRLFWQRLEDIEERLVSRVKLPLLSAPTHEYGWVEPSALVDRIKDWQNAKQPLDQADLILALLRYSPIGRRKALSPINKLDATLRPVLALASEGDSSKIGNLSGVDRALLNVAAHVRRTLLEPAEIKRLKIDGGYANSKLPILKSWRVNENKSPKNIRDWKEPCLILDVEFSNWIADHPVLSEVYRIEYRDLSVASPWRIHIDAWNDPNCRDPFWLEAMERMLNRLENGPANQEPNSAFLEALFDPGYRWESTACGAVTVALIGKDTDASGVALDALYECVSSGRVESEAMGHAIARVFNSPLAKAGRFSDRYAQLADFSSEHREFVAQSLEHLIHCWSDPKKPPVNGDFNRFAKATDSASILDLYLQSIVELGIHPREQFLASLSNVQSTGKVAKIIKAILNVPT